MKRRSLASHLPKLRAAAFAPLTVLFGMPLAHAATNLALSNGTFDAGTNPWIIAGSAAWGLDGATACGATKCLQLNIDNATVTATSEEKTNLAPGEFVTASAMMKRSSAAGAEDVSLGLVFYGSSKAPIGTTLWSHASGPADTWASVKVSAIAPPGTVTAKVVIRGKSSARLTAHVDNVVLSKIIIEDKGAQISLPRISAVAVDARKEALYVASNGTPAKFAYYHFLDDKALKEFSIGNDEVWSVVVGGDSAAYFGTASGKFYRYDTSKDAAPLLLKEFKKTSSGIRAIWSLKAGPDNCIYGGLEPDGTKTDGFRYCGSGEPTLVTLPTANDGTPTGYHVRSLAVDPGVSPASGSVYWGLGANARVHKSGFDGSSPPNPLFADKTKEYAYYTDFVKDRLFARLTGTNINQTVVLSPSGASAGAAVEKINSIGISALSPYVGNAADPCKDIVFYTKDLGLDKGGSHLSSYCLDTAAGKETGLKIQMSAAAAFAYALSPAPAKLVSVLRDPVNGKGKIVQFNLDDLHRENNTAQRVPTDFSAPVTDTGLRTLAVKDGKTYSAGFVNGDIAIGDGTNPPVLVKEPLQAEGMVVLGKHLYIGGYPNAVVKSFKLTDTGLVDSVAFTNTDLGEKYGQNRPFAMLGLPSRSATDPERLIVATVPKKNQQGALAMYTVGAPAPWTVLPAPFTGQSILALARIDDVVYGGTSVWRDKDDAKSEGTAKLFTFKPFESLQPTEVSFETDFFNTATWDRKAITALLAVKRQIWMLAEDSVLIYDHDTKKFVKKLSLTPSFTYAAWTNAWNAGSMAESNGYVYFSAHDTKMMNVYRVNISNPEKIELVRSGASGMMKVDANGDIYFLNEARVMKFNPAL